MQADEVGTRVGSKVLFENAKVRVWDFTLEPGEWSEWHRHEHDYVIVYATDAQLGLQVPGRAPARESVDDGYVSHTFVGSGEDEGLTHRLGNLGQERLRHFVIEMLDSRREQSRPMRIESSDPAEASQSTGGR